MDIALHEEIPRYTLISFISDAGGIAGVFLGFSFWSLHSILIAPLVAKLEANLGFGLKAMQMSFEKKNPCLVLLAGRNEGLFFSYPK